MELSELLRNRHSVRRFKIDDIPNSDLEALIEAAGMAPSGKNIQNWHFVVIKNKELMVRIGETIRAKNEAIAKQIDLNDPEKGRKFRRFAQAFTLFFLKAPVLVVVYATNYVPSGFQELSGIGAPDAILNDLLYRRNPGMQNIGAAVENLTLKAIDLGYGSCWLTSANYAAEEIEALLKSEGIFDREGWFIAAMLALGIPEGEPKSPKKKAVEEIWTLVE